jgi:1,4-dihydroxy-2-naphthoyl-CoA hydrolase
MEDVIRIANDFCKNTLSGATGMEFTVVNRGYVEATMPVDERTVQPYGLLHGGASAALAETIGSFGSHFIVAPEGGIAVGVELNINHIKGKRNGVVTGKGTLIHQGKSMHVWSIEIVDENGVMLAISRLTVMVKSGQK